MIAATPSVDAMDISWAAALAGLLFGLSLIIAIGPQNAFVLRQGLRRERVPVIVAVCAISDVVLIVAGVAGMGALLQRAPALLWIVRLGGAAFLLGYAVLALRRALHPASRPAEPDAATSTRAAFLTAVAFTWLNPAVYLDTVILLGSVANTHPGQQWTFALGASAGSIAWFVALGYGAGVISPAFARPVAWRVLDAGIAVIMTTIGVRLVTAAVSGSAPHLHFG
jgi:L-lysine exporter family protein LysE/ArgO